MAAFRVHEPVVLIKMNQRKTPSLVLRYRVGEFLLNQFRGFLRSVETFENAG